MSEESSFYKRPMTIEETLADNARYQRELHERMERELPSAMAEFVNNYTDDDDIEEEIEEEINGINSDSGQPNGNGYIRNNYSKLTSNQPTESDLMLAVREREIHELRKEKDSILKKYESEVNSLKDDLARTSMEKQRAAVSLKEAQDLLFTLKSQNSSLLEEREKLIESERSLKTELQLQKLTVQDKDKFIKILENGSQDNRQILLLEKQIQAKDEKHQQDLKNLNDQLELSFKKCKDLEREKFELEKRVKFLDERNDEVMTQKADTVAKLSSQIQTITEDYQKLIAESQTNDRRLRADINLKELREQALLKELEEIKSRMPTSGRSDDGFTLQSRLVELEKKLSCCREENYKLTSRIAEMEKEVAKREAHIIRLKEENSKSEHSLEMYNNQYLKFHEEEMERLERRLKEELEVMRLEKESVIESLKAENEQVKQLYLARETEYSAVDVRKLQADLEMAKDRIIQLQKTHSEYCQPVEQNQKQTVAKCDVGTSTIEVIAESSSVGTSPAKKTFTEGDVAKILQDLVALHEQERRQQEQQNVMKPVSKSDVGTSTDDEVGESSAEKKFTEAEVAKIIQDMVALHERERSQQEARLMKQTPVSKSEAATSTHDEAGGRERMFSEIEVAKMLQDIAALHEQERRQYEIRLEALHHQNLFNLSKAQKPMSDAKTETATVSSDLNSELIAELWKTLEKLRAQNEVLTARTQTQTPDTEMALSRISEQLVAATRRSDAAESERQQLQLHCQKLTEKELRLRNELMTVSDKYERLKVQAKRYKEYFTNAVTKLKEENKNERRIWEEERNELEERIKVWEVEKEKREKALLELQADVRSLKTPLSSKPVSVQDLMDKLMQTIVNDKPARKGHK